MRHGRARVCPRGFAAVTAIVLIGLVGTTLAGLAMMFAADARRTRAAADEAQLRQLLIAGAADVQHRLNNGQTRLELKLAAPAEGTLHLLASASGDTVDAVVIATVGERRAQQTLRFVRQGQPWKLAAVDPDSPATTSSSVP